MKSTTWDGLSRVLWGIGLSSAMAAPHLTFAYLAPGVTLSIIGTVLSGRGMRALFREGQIEDLQELRDRIGEGIDETIKWDASALVCITAGVLYRYSVDSPPRHFGLLIPGIVAAAIGGYCLLQSALTFRRLARVLQHQGPEAPGG